MKTHTYLALLALLLNLPVSLNAAGLSALHTSSNPCQPTATIVPVANSYGCFSFKASGGVSGPYGYTWEFGDGTTASGDSVLHCYAADTVSSVMTITVSSNSPALCGPNPTQQSYSLTLNPPSPTLCVNSAPSISITATSVTVWVGYAPPEVHYLFDYGDGTSPDIASTHSYTACGNYILEVRTWGMTNPQTICYSYSAVNISCSLATAVFENQPDLVKVSLFPNPSAEIVYLNSTEPINGIQLLDVTGREYFVEKGLSTKSYTIRVADFPKGTYVVKLLYNSGAERNIKLIRL